MTPRDETTPDVGEARHSGIGLRELLRADVSRGADRTRILVETARTAARTLDAHTALVALHDEGGWTAFSDRGAELAGDSIRLVASTNVLERVRASGDPVIAVERMQRLLRSESAAMHELRAVLAVPLWLWDVGGARPVRCFGGCLYADRRGDASPFEPGDVELVRDLAAVAERNLSILRHLLGEGEESADRETCVGGRPRSLEIADRVYAAGADPQRWRELMHLVASAVSARRALLTSRQGRREVVLAASDREATGRVPAGYATVELGGEESLRLRLDRLNLSPDEQEFALVLGRHIVRARTLDAMLVRAEARGQLAQAALDRMAGGVLILDGEGRIEIMNSTARQLLESASEVAIVEERLCFRRPELASQLERLREASRAAHDGGRHLEAEILRLSREGGRPPLEILAISLNGLEPAEACGGAAERSLCGAACALFFSDPELAAETPSAILRRLYTLTAAEARVVAEILRGHGIDEAARALDLRRETIRTHLKHIFTKVGTTRQVDLVRLLLTGAAGVRW
ncbi:MAG: helix-turn-helix transcriptional regulator [Thermoanaerobaculia bacterium]